MPKSGRNRCAGRLLQVLIALVAMTAGKEVLAQDPNHLIQTICIACHNEYTLQAGLNLQNFDAKHPQLNPVVAEKMIRKLNSGLMPPREMPRDQ